MGTRLGLSWCKRGRGSACTNPTVPSAHPLSRIWHATLTGSLLAVPPAERGAIEEPVQEWNPISWRAIAAKLCLVTPSTSLPDTEVSASTGSSARPEVGCHAAAQLSSGQVDIRSGARPTLRNVLLALAEPLHRQRLQAEEVDAFPPADLRSGLDPHVRELVQ